MAGEVETKKTGDQPLPLSCGNSKGAKPLAVDAGNAMAAAAVDGCVNEPSSEEMVEMPEGYLDWLLAQSKETDPVPALSDYNTQDLVELKCLQEDIEFLQAAQDEFFVYQASVQEQLEKHGRVMVPAAAVGPTDQFHEAIDEFWYGQLEEYNNSSGSNNDTVGDIVVGI